MKDPLFSIITPTLNSERTIKKTVESVLSQNLEDFEYLIVDGGSSDGTLDYVRELAAFENNLSFISEKDDGIFFAMNKGINLTRGSYIGIINSDDWFTENALHLVKEAIEKNVPDIIHGDMIAVPVDQKYESDRLVRSRENLLNVRSSVNHPGCFVKRECYIECGLYDTRYKIAADYDFFLRCWKQGVSFHHIEEPLCFFREGGTSTKAPFRRDWEVFQIQLSHLGTRGALAIYAKSLIRTCSKFMIRPFVSKKMYAKIRNKWLSKHIR